jgi:putative endonuclease
MHFVYMVRCADGTLYTGYARDPRKREKVHNTGRGAHYTACRRPVSLVYFESAKSRGDALRRECRIKRLTRPQKETLIDKGSAPRLDDGSATRATPARLARGFRLRNHQV